jgi:hypothetical protein
MLIELGQREHSEDRHPACLGRQATSLPTFATYSYGGLVAPRPSQAGSLTSV